MVDPSQCLGIFQVSETSEWTNRIPRVQRCSLRQRFGFLWRDGGGTFSAETSEGYGERLASGHLGNSNKHIVLTQEGVLRCRSFRRLELAERKNKKIMENVKGLPWDQRPPKDHADGGPFEGRERPRGTPGGPKTGSRTCAVPCVLWTDPRLPGMLGNKTRISPHGGLQSKTARVARPTGIRRNGNIGTGTIRTNARVRNRARGPCTSSHRDSWK